MQAKLPDVNAALVRHRSAALAALHENDHPGAIISFDAMIALLPEDYRIEINTEKYYQLVSEKKTVSCTACTEKLLLKDISLHKLLLSVIDQFVSGDDSINVWYCPACTEQNIFTDDGITTTRYVEPSYFGVVPSPPTKRGTTNRKVFEYEFKKWFDIVMSELEAKIGAYRADYAAQTDIGIPEIKDSDVLG